MSCLLFVISAEQGPRHAQRRRGFWLDARPFLMRSPLRRAVWLPFCRSDTDVTQAHKGVSVRRNLEPPLTDRLN